MEYYSRIFYDRFTLLLTLVGGVVRVKNLLLFSNSNGFYGEGKTKTVGVFRSSCMPLYIFFVLYVYWRRFVKVCW